MKNKRNKTPIVLLTILLALFILHFTQYQFHWIKLKPLQGFYLDAKRPDFSWKDWFSGQYQEKKDKYLTDHFGFRSFFVRLNHQWRFSLFNKAKAVKVTIGKNNYLYEQAYIEAWYGTDFVGHDCIEQRLYKFKCLQDTLNKLEQRLIMVLAPGKGSFYPEFIPEQFHKEQETTNISVYRHYIDKWNLNCIDFNQYFIDNKYKSPYPLYPQYGIHWSYYAMCLAADSILGYVEKINNIDMPRMYWSEIRMSQPEFDDADISQALNLLFAPRTFEMAYPIIQFESNSKGTPPSLLVVSDSFYWGIYNMGWSNLFSNDQFWYYNETVYPGSTSTKDVNLQEEILKYDIIIILSTDSNLHDFGWEFIENSYHVFFK